MSTIGVFFAIIVISIVMEKEVKNLKERISKLEEDIYDLKNSPKNCNNL